MDDTKTTKVKSNKPSNTSQNNEEKSESILQRPQNKMLHPTGVIQRIRPRNRDAIVSKEIELSKSTDNMSEEFDSDQHVENASDWHDELDVVQMPHLLGPSATKHSPVPVEHQHLSIPPSSCYRIMIECNQFYPIASYIPCSELGKVYYHVNN